MNASSRFNTLSALTVSAAILGYCTADSQPGLAAFSLLVLGFAWWTGRRGTPLRVPRAGLNLLVLGAVVYAAVSVVQGRDAVVSDLARFLVFIQLIKFFDRKSPRDDAQAITLSLFVAIGALLTSNTLAVGAILFLYALLMTATAMLLQIERGVRGLGLARGLAPGDDQGRRALLVRGGSAGRHFASVTAFAVSGSFILAGIAFFATPRGLGQDRFGKLGVSAAGSTIGFTENVQLGRAGLLSASPTPVMDVLVLDAAGNNIGPDLGSLYLRGVVRNRYNPDNGGWTFDDPGRVASQVLSAAGERVALVPDSARRGGGTEQRVTLRGATGVAPSSLFALWAPVALQLQGQDDILAAGADLALHRRNGSGGRLAYTVWSEPETTLTEPADIPGTPGHPLYSNPNVRALAARLLSGRGIPLEPPARSAHENRAAAATFQLYLRENYPYTREMVAPKNGQDPIEMFLFDTRRGHCEYFASALVAMCQSVGIDARLVAGYLAAEFNGVTGQFVVRQSNAHAWAEVNLAPGRWLTVDASPEGELERQRQGGGGGLLSRARQLWDAMEFAWNDRVVSFDEQRRAGAVGGLLRRFAPLEGVIAAARAVEARLRTLVPSLQGSKGIPRGSRLLVLVVIVAGAALYRRRLAFALRTITAALGRGAVQPSWSRATPEARFYARLLSTIDRAGLAKPRSRPPLAHAAGLLKTDAPTGEAAWVLSDLYYQARFGGRKLSKRDLADAHRLIDALDRRLRGGGRA